MKRVRCHGLDSIHRFQDNQDAEADTADDLFSATCFE